MTESTDWQVTGRDGTVLRGLRWDVEAPRALVYIAHGLAEHVARYGRFAATLNAAGLSVAGHDHRGHRRSLPGEDDLGHAADRGGFDLMADDLAAGMRARKAEDPDLPLVLFGHSMGSFLAQRVLCSGDAGCQMAILSGSNGPPPPLAAIGRVIARIEKLRLGPRGKSQLIHGLAFDANNKPFEPAPTKLEWLSRDRTEVDAYVADPFCGFVASVATWIALLDALPGLTNAAALNNLPIDLPVLLAAGGEDPIGDKGRGVERLRDLYARQGVRDLTCTIYPEARHEILNEINRDAVTADIIGWIEARLSDDAA